MSVKCKYFHSADDKNRTGAIASDHLHKNIAIAWRRGKWHKNI